MRTKTRLMPFKMTTNLRSLQSWSARERGNKRTNSQSSEEDKQTKAQVEDRLQAKGEREVDLGVDSDQARAPAATLLLVRVKTDSDFLEQRVSKVKSWKLANTYGGNFGNDVGDRRATKTTSKATEGGGTSVDGNDELNGNRIRALVVVAVVELGNDRVALLAEVGEGLLDVGVGPLGDDLGDSASEGHGTGSEDSEDGRETHGEEV